MNAAHVILLGSKLTKSAKCKGVALSVPSVSEAISGRAAPSLSSTSARSANVLNVRPPVETHRMAATFESIVNPTTFDRTD